MVFGDVEDILEKFAKLFYGLNIDEYLDKRDSPPFDKEWVDADNSMKAIKIEALSSVERIRERVYNSVYKITNSDELAGYISDDFELILINELQEEKNSWIEEKLNVYGQGCLPNRVERCK